VLSGLIDFVLAFVVLVGMMGLLGAPLSARALWIVPLLLLAFVASLAWGSGSPPSTCSIATFATRPLPHAGLAVRHSHRLSEQLLGEPWRTVYGLNPMVGVVEGYRGRCSVRVGSRQYGPLSPVAPPSSC
jgi:lipopolysaccharide transport system permease protein